MPEYKGFWIEAHDPKLTDSISGDVIDSTDFWRVRTKQGGSILEKNCDGESGAKEAVDRRLNPVGKIVESVEFRIARRDEEPVPYDCFVVELRCENGGVLTVITYQKDAPFSLLLGKGDELAIKWANGQTTLYASTGRNLDADAIEAEWVGKRINGLTDDKNYFCLRLGDDTWRPSIHFMKGSGPLDNASCYSNHKFSL